jgi:hypothetical protein
MSDPCLDSVAATETERVNERHTRTYVIAQGYTCTANNMNLTWELTKKMNVLRHRGRNMKFDEHPMLI